MEHWRARIKEKGNDAILTPEWLSGDFDYIKDDDVRGYTTRNHLRKLWGLDAPDVEWYVLEEVKDETN